MWADRIHAMGVAESIDLQLQMEVLIDVPRSREALVTMKEQLFKMASQVYHYQEMYESALISLKQEKAVNLDLKVDNKGLLEENAYLAKENRRLKKEIDKLMSNG